MSKILVTGAAGFIGFHLTQRLLARGDEVVGLDNLNDYYRVQLKEDRLAQLVRQPLPVDRLMFVVELIGRIPRHGNRSVGRSG